MNNRVYGNLAVKFEEPCQSAEEYYAELVNANLEAMRAIAMRLLRNEEDAEEAVSNAHYKGIARGHECEEPQYFGSWIWRITYNEALMIWRRKKRRDSNENSLNEMMEFGFHPACGEPTVDDTIWERYVRRVVKTAVAELPHMYRDVVRMRDIEGLTNEEVSAIMGLGVCGVKSRLHRGRLVLRRRLTKFWKEEYQQ